MKKKPRRPTSAERKLATAAVALIQIARSESFTKDRDIAREALDKLKIDWRP